MSKFFTSIEELFNDLEPSVGQNPPAEGGNGNEFVRNFQPERGIDVLYENLNWVDRSSNTTRVSASFDGRLMLGTTTLNNRGYWEDSNFNKSTYQSLFKGEDKEFKVGYDSEHIDSTEIIDANGDVIVVPSNNSTNFSTYRFSIDALPYVTNPNNDNEIIRLDRYWDKEINPTEFGLASEGKINYYIYPRVDRRVSNENIDTYGYYNKNTAGGGKNRFDYFVSSSLANGGDDDKRGYYLFNLDWGDGSTPQYTSKLELLSNVSLFEHFYDKPGFYNITGVVVATDSKGKIQIWEKFQTNILLNPSENYELNLINYENFATIGGVSTNSVLVKTSANILGINPITLDSSKSNSEVINSLNLLDRLQLLDFLNKNDIDINPFFSFLLPYSQEIDDELVSIMDVVQYGCTDPQALNYDETATNEFYPSNCQYSLSYNFKLPTYNSSVGALTVKFIFMDEIENILRGTPLDEETQTGGWPNTPYHLKKFSDYSDALGILGSGPFANKWISESLLLEMGSVVTISNEPNSGNPSEVSINSNDFINRTLIVKLTVDGQELEANTLVINSDEITGINQESLYETGDLKVFRQVQSYLEFSTYDANDPDRVNPNWIVSGLDSQVFGYHRIQMPNIEPSNELNGVSDITLNFTYGMSEEGDAGETGSSSAGPITQGDLYANEGDGWYPRNRTTGEANLDEEYVGDYHIHENGTVHIGYFSQATIDDPDTPPMDLIDNVDNEMLITQLLNVPPAPDFQSNVVEIIKEVTPTMQQTLQWENPNTTPFSYIRYEADVEGAGLYDVSGNVISHNSSEIGQYYFDGNLGGQIKNAGDEIRFVVQMNGTLNFDNYVPNISLVTSNFENNSMTEYLGNLNQYLELHNVDENLLQYVYKIIVPQKPAVQEAEGNLDFVQPVYIKLNFESTSGTGITGP